MQFLVELCNTCVLCHWFAISLWWTATFLSRFIMTRHHSAFMRISMFVSSQTNCPQSRIEVRPTALPSLLPLAHNLDAWPWFLIAIELYSWHTHTHTLIRKSKSIGSKARVEAGGHDCNAVGKQVLRWKLLVCYSGIVHLFYISL